MEKIEHLTPAVPEEIWGHMDVTVHALDFELLCFGSQETGYFGLTFEAEISFNDCIWGQIQDSQSWDRTIVHLRTCLDPLTLCFSILIEHEIYLCGFEKMPAFELHPKTN